ncbi:PqqD family peptide modification chaperone [Lachnotalea glycerini]|uniref:Radical SAM protein n=1 Tax=Lachnotalea glycerini TaxID=1763509 RepID=A0A371JBA0_9FIRM|nr:PqqD family peptide modification chaperone [Lachnotalea glycerini]RDY30014.1 radical SAM protein [Lachnotalea glycerini]
MEKLNIDLTKYHIIKMGGQVVLLSDYYKQWLKVSCTGYDILQRMDGNHDVDQIVEELTELYDIPKDIIENDCNEFISELQCAEVLDINPDNFDNTKMQEIYFDISDVCFYRCNYCFKAVGTDTEKANFMSLSEVMKKFEDIKAHGMIKKPIVYITGGEPLLNPEIDQIVKYLYEQNCFVILCTDGRLLDETKALLYKNMVDMFIFPLDGSEEKLNDAVRGEGSYASVMKAIDVLNEKEMFFAISITPTVANIKNVKEMISFAYEKRALGCILNETINISEDGEVLDSFFTISEEDYDEMTNAINLFSGVKYSWKNNKDKRSSKKNNVFFVSRDSKRCANTPSLIKSKNSCGMGMNEIYVSSKGYSPCHMLNIPAFRKGTIEEVREFNIPYNELHKCKECDVKLFCLGGCRGRVYYDSKDIKGCIKNCDDYKNYYMKYIENVNGHLVKSKEKD